MSGVVDGRSERLESPLLELPTVRGGGPESLTFSPRNPLPLRVRDLPPRRPDTLPTLTPGTPP